MAESSFPVNFPRCPHCGSTETLGQLALQEARLKGYKPDIAFPSLEKAGSPLIPLEKVIGVTLPLLVQHYDICAGCGVRRCTRAEIIDAPITMAQPPGGGHGGGGFPFGSPNQ